MESYSSRFKTSKSTPLEKSLPQTTSVKSKEGQDALRFLARETLRRQSMAKEMAKKIREEEELRREEVLRKRHERLEQSRATLALKPRRSSHPIYPPSQPQQRNSLNTIAYPMWMQQDAMMQPRNHLSSRLTALSAPVLPTIHGGTGEPNGHALASFERPVSTMMIPRRHTMPKQTLVSGSVPVQSVDQQSPRTVRVNSLLQKADAILSKNHLRHTSLTAPQNELTKAEKAESRKPSAKSKKKQAPKSACPVPKDISPEMSRLLHDLKRTHPDLSQSTETFLLAEQLCQTRSELEPVTIQDMLDQCRRPLSGSTTSTAASSQLDQEEIELEKSIEELNARLQTLKRN